MAENSKIEWTDHTFNPWIGCAKVSPGCAHCYAAAQNKFRKWVGDGEWGGPRRKTSAGNWNEPRRWNTAAERAGVRRRVFCASLADWLDDDVPAEWLTELLSLIRETPHLDWLLLTKRPENFFPRMKAAWDGAGVELGRWISQWAYHKNRPPQNVWVGTTVENQEMMEKRHGMLMGIPARVHFWSAEPLLSRLNVSSMWREHGAPQWVICGGESGPLARPMSPEWPQHLQMCCESWDVPFFFKQWGEWGEGPQIGGHHTMRRAGKEKAGRHLGGREWSEFPEL